jgi:hypothetical protein
MTHKHFMIMGALGVLLCGCAVATKDTVVLTQPVSNVQSAVQSAMDDDEPENRDIDFGSLPRYLAIVPLANTTDEIDAPEVMRRTLQNHLSTKNYRIMHWREVDLQLTELDAAVIADDARLSAALGVDGLVRGTISSYEFFYAGIYAHIKLGVDLSLHQASGELLWTDQLEVTTRAGGVSTSAWGLLLNAALAAMHLNEKNLLAAADELGREVGTAFPEPPGYQGMAGPVIENVIHDGVNRTLHYGDTLTVGVKGEQGQRATVSIKGIGSFDLKEQQPGEYIAALPVSAEWNVSNTELVGRLINAAGESTRWISPVGLITIDNLPPQPVAALSLQAHSGNAYLKWQAPPDVDVAAYRIYQLQGRERTLVQESELREVSFSAGQNFGQLRYEVTALDRVGNESSGVTAGARVYPAPGAAAATVAVSRLGGVVRTDLLLSASNSPYILAEPMLVEAGATLFVEPGVVIKAAPEGKLSIKGSAWFWGEQGGIRFEPQLNGRLPGQYLVLDSQQTVSLQGVVFERGGIAVQVLSGSPDLNDVQIRNSEYSALSISGSASPTISGCLIEGSNTSGVVIENHARPVFKGCKFLDNQPFHIQSTSVYEIVAEGNRWQPAASATTVLGKVRY